LSSKISQIIGGKISPKIHKQITQLKMPGPTEYNPQLNKSKSPS